MTKTFVSALSTALVLSSVPAADAQSTRVVAQLTARDVVRLSGEENFKASINERGDVKVDFPGLSRYAFVKLYRDGSSLQLYAYWVNTSATLRLVNTWNKEHRFSTAYLDDDGDPWLQSDIDLEGGVTEAQVRKWLQLGDASFRAFERRLNEAK